MSRRVYDLIHIIKEKCRKKRTVQMVATDEFKIFREIYGDDFVYEVDERDEMFQYLSLNTENPRLKYYEGGESMIQTFDECFKTINYDLNAADNVLDFACGYGRFTRFLVGKIGYKKITVSDIDKNAVDFCKARFKVNGFYSVEKPEILNHRNKYDVIFVNSLFSHLSHQLWISWIRCLYNFLEEDGILVFSTHGTYCYDILDDLAKKIPEAIVDGFFYAKQSETKRLSTEDYGTAYVSYEFVENTIHQNNLGSLIAYYPKKLWNFQDIYILQK